MYRRAINGPWPWVLGVFLISRLYFLTAGALAVTLLPRATPAGSPLPPPGALSYWANWDGAWYSGIAAGGYGALPPASTAFFPLYPLLIRAGTILGGGPALWGVLISLVSTLFTFYFLYRIAEDEWNVQVARAATLSLAFFPTAFFLNAVYTEALFLVLTTGAYWAARVRRDLLLAGILGALATATRNVGLLLLIPLGYEWMKHREEHGWKGLAALGLVPAGLAAYTLYLWAAFGDPLISARQQGEYWGRTLTDPFTTVYKGFMAAGGGIPYLLDPEALFLSHAARPALQVSNVINLVSLAFFLGLVLISATRISLGLWLYTLAIVGLPILTPSPIFPLMSLPRFLLAAFPLFLMMGVLLSRWRLALIVWLTLSAAAGALLTALFVTWRWVA